MGNQRLVSLVFIVVGFSITIYNGNLYLGARASSDWPTVDGIVVESRVKKWLGTDNKLNYEAIISYKYEVEGVSYHSEQIEFLPTTSKRASVIREKVEAFPVGDTIVVHYDPKQPGEAVLITGTNWKYIFFFIMGLIFFVVGVLLGVTGQYRR